NALTFSAGGTIAADNTDAPGMIAALPHPAAGVTALVLGAGGTARAAVWALLDAGAADVAVWNRTAARARALAAELGARFVEDAPDADVLVNASAAGLGDPGASFAELPLTAADVARFGCVVDFVYGAGETALARAAREGGVALVDGPELLVRQAA